MRQTLSLALLLLFISCNEESNDIYLLRQQVDNLQSRIDSFQLALTNCKTDYAPLKSSSKRKTAKVTPKKTTTYSTTSTSRSYGVSRQCSATTKKGTRCKRMTRSGYYCWQHGG